MKKIIFNLAILSFFAITLEVTAQNGIKGQAIVQNVTVYEADSIIQAHANDTTFTILDVRTPAEFYVARLYNAINVDYYSPNFTSIISGFDTSYAYLVYCGVGGRSALASNIMIGLNFQVVYNMLGGINQWVAASLPVDSLTTEIIDFNIFSVKVNVFPNPSNGLVFYQIEDMNNNKYTIELFDVTGKLLTQKKYSSLKKSDNQFNLTNYSKGLYFIKVICEDFSMTKRVIKY